MRSATVIVLLGSAALPGPIAPPPLFLQHVAVIVGDGSPTLQNATLLIRDGRISHVDRSGTLKPPLESQIVDASGKFAIAGLWDMHVHLFNNFLQDGSENHAYFFPLLVANGVVGVRDMYTDADDIAVARRWNEETESGKLIGPRVMVSSRVVDGDSRMARTRSSCTTASKGGKPFASSKHPVPASSKCTGSSLATPTSPSRMNRRNSGLRLRVTSRSR
jgi:imidazolonepropionase-like amidohydrolase